MNIRLWLVVAWGLAVMLTAACGDDTEEPEHCDVDHDHDQDGSCDPGQHLGSPSKATCQDDSTLTYGNFAKDFFAKYCTRCHSVGVQGAARMLAPADHNFDTLAEVELLKDHIDQVAAAGPTITNTAMPPSDPKPSDEERKKLGEWLACEAPE